VHGPGRVAEEPLDLADDVRHRETGELDLARDLEPVDGLERLDSGLLGVVCVRVGNTAQAARIVRGPRSGQLIRLNAGEVVVESDTGTLPVGIDGEHVVLPSPVVCRSAPGALRVRVPRRRPGTSRASGAAPDWPRVVRLALGR
jgi:diacylglycerol kinase family enzyme